MTVIAITSVPFHHHHHHQRSNRVEKSKFSDRISTHLTRQTPCSKCGLEKNLRRELEEVPPPLRGDKCLPRLRSRRFGGSRARPWTWSSLRRKTQHVKCILRATSDRWQACMHVIRSRRRAVTDLRWTLCLLDFDTIRA